MENFRVNLMKTGMAALISLLLVPLMAENKKIEVFPTDNFQDVLNKIEPGNEILLHKGEYKGIFTITKGGTENFPVRIAPFGDGEVFITSPENAFKPVPLKKPGSADLNRTLSITNGAYITVENLNIHNGIRLGENGKYPQEWLDTEDNAYRHVFGVDIRNLSKFSWNLKTLCIKKYLKETQVPEKQWYEKLGCYVKNITIKNNLITGRGICLWHASFNKITDNKIEITEAQILGIVLQQVCYENIINNNDVSGSFSPEFHHQGEGIRLVNFSNYNKITKNIVHDIKGAGFGITADIHCDYNLYSENICRNIQSICYTDQLSNSYNEWSNNTAENAAIGFDFSSWWKDYPTKDSLSEGTIVKNNIAINCKMADCVAGWIQNYHFVGNKFQTVFFCKDLYDNFFKLGSTWDNNTELPDYVKVGFPARFVKNFHEQ